jgi:arsenate reductase
MVYGLNRNSDTMMLYHNPRCSKSRQALAILEERGEDFQIRKYMDDLPTEQELRTLLQHLNMTASELIRKGEAAFKEQALANASEDELVVAMLSDPKLIERPILVVGQRAVVGRPPERILDLLP